MAVVQVGIVLVAVTESLVLMFVGVWNFTTVFTFSWFVVVFMFMVVMKIVHMIVLVHHKFVMVRMLMIFADMQVDSAAH